MTARPPLAVTLGDPAGIGPEIVVKAWSALKASGPAFFVVGDLDSISAAFPTGAAACEKISRPSEAPSRFRDRLPVIDSPSSRPVVPGEPRKELAASIVRWVETGFDLCMRGEASGLVTAPISKAPLYAAGFPFPGHTELLADLAARSGATVADGPVMMLAAADLRAALVTIHTPLRNAPSEISIGGVVRTARVLNSALKSDFGIRTPRLVLAALNPHGGEGGAMGTEEVEILAPAVEALRGEGIDIRGPRPADTLFHAEARKSYDAVVCLYHDQALIPVKTLDFWGGVNVTLGLPIVRTSPDHGTGFDIAGRGVARPDSLIAALRLAAQIADRRRAYAG